MRAREFISETKGLPFPGTYEQEYAPFKQVGSRKITAMTNEALDSAYPFTTDNTGRKFYFTTDAGVEYYVSFVGDEMVEIAFSASMEGSGPKTKLTGTGDSRKVMGTVVKIVQDYLDVHQPTALYFTAERDEPSRVKLYSAMMDRVDKALPGYQRTKDLDLGSGIAYMIKRKEKVTEALDSSYPYEFKNNAYYFTTDGGEQYKVLLNGTKKVSVSFFARGENNMPKNEITGTGDSRKVFGTVISIVKDYVSKHQPNILVFSADNDEPSRIKLYNMLASQAGKVLPGYNFTKTLKDGMFTDFYLTRDGVKVPKLDIVKNVAQRALDVIAEEDLQRSRK